MSASRFIKCTSLPELPSFPYSFLDAYAYLRDDKQFFIDHPGAVPITNAQGEVLKKLIEAPSYIECSSKSQENVKGVFDAAIRVVLQPPKQKGKAQKACSVTAHIFLSSLPLTSEGLKKKKQHIGVYRWFGSFFNP